jgi:hypothetical protein
VERIPGRLGGAGRIGHVHAGAVAVHACRGQSRAGASQT